MTSLQDKFIASILLAHGIFGIAWTFWVASQIGYPVLFLAQTLTLVVISVAAATGWFRHRRWGVWLALVFYIAQLVHVVTPTYQWSLTLGLHLMLSFGWLSEGQIGINLLALGMLLWLCMRTFSPGNPFDIK